MKLPLIHLLAASALLLASASAQLTPGTVTAASASRSELTWIDVTKPPYSAAGNAQARTDAAITATTATLTSATATFVAGDVGKYIRVEGAGVAGADLITTIAARNSSTSITLTATAGTTVSGKAVFWGTNDSTAVQAAITAAATSRTTRTVWFPPGKKYLVNLTVPKNVKLLGGWRGSVIQGIFTTANLADELLSGTVLFPATTASPVIMGDDSTGTVFGSGVEGFVISGSSAKHGTGIQFGNDWTEDGYSSSGLDIVRCHVSGFATAIKHSNAVQGDIAFCSWNDCTVGVEIWRHDGITVRNCDSNNVGTNFRVGSSKNVDFPTGNYNSVATFIDQTDSSVTVGNVNVEHPTAEVFAVRKSGDESRLIVDHVKVLDNATGILCRNYYAEADKDQCFIDIRSGIGNNSYYDTANSNTPKSMPTAYIRRYTSNAFTTLNLTERCRRVYITTEELRRSRTLSETFATRLAASPYGDLGWTVTNVSGTFSAAASSSPLTPGGLRLASPDTSATNVARLTTSSALVAPGNQAYWSVRGFINSEYISTAKLRFGIYEDTAGVKPNNGVGIRVDTSVPDTNIQLEIINGGVSSVVDTGVAASNLSGFKEVVLTRTSAGVSCVIKTTAGVPLAPEVWYATTLPAWATYHRLAVYSGTSAVQWQAVNVAQVDYIQYPDTNF